MLEVTRECGEKTWTMGVPGKCLIHLTSPNDIEFMHNDRFDDFLKGKDFQDCFLEILGRTSIFSTDGEVWKTQRKIVAPMFAGKVLRDKMLTTFHRHGEKLLKAIDAEVGAFDIQKLFFCYTFDVICDIAFGQDVDTLNNCNHPFAKAFDSANAICSWRNFLPPSVWKTARFFKIGQEAAMPGYQKTMRDVVDKFVQDALTADSDALEHETHVLALAIKALRKDAAGKQEFKQELSAAYLTDLAMTFIIAGRDTTAWALTAMLRQLMHDPERYAKAQAAVDRVAPSGHMEFEEAKSMDYIQAVMFEALRLEPSVAIEFKVAQADMELADRTQIHTGDLVFYSPYVICRLKKIWGADADCFRPERWSEEDDLKAFKVSDYKYPVFNIKRRQCLGKAMAVLEVKSVFASLLSRYCFSLVPGQNTGYLFGATISLKDGLFVKASRRPTLAAVFS